MKYRLRDEAAYREVGETVFVVTADRALHKMANPTALAIFRTLESGPASVDELASTLTRRFDVDNATARADAQAFITTLVERKLVAEDAKSRDAKAD